MAILEGEEEATVESFRDKGFEVSGRKGIWIKTLNYYCRVRNCRGVLFCSTRGGKDRWPR